MSEPSRPGDPRHARRGFAREARGLALVWLALLALMLASLGSAYLRLGVGNLVAGLAIATLKAGLVAACFMRLRRASAMTRLAAAAGLATLLLLMSLSLADYATRRVEPARWQSPRQLAPLLGSGGSAGPAGPGGIARLAGQVEGSGRAAGRADAPAARTAVVAAAAPDRHRAGAPRPSAPPW